MKKLFFSEKLLFSSAVSGLVLVFGLGVFGCNKTNTAQQTTPSVVVPTDVPTLVPTEVPTPQQASVAHKIKAKKLSVTMVPNPQKNPIPTQAECSAAWQQTADIVYAGAPSYGFNGVRLPENQMIGLINDSSNYCKAYSVLGVTPQIIATYLLNQIKRWPPFNVTEAGDNDPVGNPWIGPGGNSYQQGWTQSFDVDHAWGATMGTHFAYVGNGYTPPSGTPTPTPTPVFTSTPIGPTPTPSCGSFGIGCPTPTPTLVVTATPVPVVTVTPVPVVTNTPAPVVTPSSALSTIQQIYNLAGAWLSSQGNPTPVPTSVPTVVPTKAPTVKPTPTPVNPGPGPGVG